MKDCPTCHGDGYEAVLVGYNEYQEPELEAQPCGPCDGSGDFPDFDGAGIA
ncbi:hypothetical protein D3C87_777610 [compost metagenome]